MGQQAKEMIHIRATDRDDIRDMVLPERFVSHASIGKKGGSMNEVA